MKHTSVTRTLSVLLILCLLLSLLSVTGFAAAPHREINLGVRPEDEIDTLSPEEQALAAPLPEYNGLVRHQVCTELSDQALSYYTGSYTYEALSALPGAASNGDSYTACQNNQLYNALQTLMSSTHSYYTSYSGTGAGSMAYYWNRTDNVQGSDTYVMFYCDEDGSIGSMQREHIWPKSRASYYQKNGGADLHHLRPSYGSLNGAKSNHRFGNIVGKYASYTSGQVNGKTCYWVYGAGDLFECKDDVKGDVARILLYVYTRWGQPNLYTEVSSDYLPPMDSDDSQNTGLPAVESLETLLQWCQDDPVDTWEMRRNDLIQNVQGNRNVFIDYPELAWLMFGEEIPAGMQTPSSQGCQHQWAETGRTAPTCTETGAITYTCPLCGAVRTETLPALGHADDNGDGLCDRCGQSLGSFVLTTGLNPGDQVLLYCPAASGVLSLNASGTRLAPQAAAPTGNRLEPEPGMAVLTVEAGEGDNFYLCSETGYLTSGDTGNALSYQTQANEYSLWYLVPAAAENSVYVYNTNAAYNGNKNQALEYYSGNITTYGFNDTKPEIYTFQLFVRSQGQTPHTHVWTLTERVEPDCTTEGYETYACDCGETRTEILPALGHDYQGVVTAPTCTEAGFTTYTCSRCEDSYTDDETPALGHDYQEVVTAPTCTEAGFTTYTCSRCQDSYTDDETPALGHDYQGVVTAPTCTEAGFTTYTCSRCDDSYVADETEALGHDWGEGIVTREPTETEEGERTYTCSCCGQTRAEAIPVLEPTPFRFDDVQDENKYFFEPVYWAYFHDPQITNGSSPTLFSPSKVCTRAQVVTFLYRAAGEPEVENAENPFTDLKETGYYYKAVLWAVQNEITSGTSATTFSPNANCTRAQIVTFLWRYAGKPSVEGMENPFTDVPAGKSYSDAVVWAFNTGITKGKTDTTFAPNSTCSRGEVVTFLYRLLGKE